MLSLKKAIVSEVVRAEDGRAELSVSVGGETFTAIAFDALAGRVSAGDEVIVNTTAVDLGLGSGGVHFVLWNLKNDRLDIDGEGHIMKLRYTPLQFACLAAEETKGPHHESLKDATDLEGLPVIIGTLHSQLAPAVATLKHINPSVRVVYIMTDGAALPLALSRTVAELKEKKLLDATVTAGNAFGGDLEAINIYSGLIAAKVAGRADVAIVSMGPGIVGTDTALGFSGIEQGQVVNAVNALGGRPIAIPRISFKDVRERHQGLSHHTVTALGLAALARATIVFPAMDEAKADMIFTRVRGAGLDRKHDIRVIENGVTGKALERYGVDVSTMGRGFDEEPEFFLAAGAAAIAALEMLGEKDDR